MNRNDYGLRDYQIELKSQVYAAWEYGARGVMCQAATGTGKTILATSIIRDVINEGHILVVAHRREILSQIRQSLKVMGLQHELNEGRITVDSIQKLSRNLSTNTHTYRLIIIDEAHHATAKTYKILWQHFPDARFLGLTATPCRLKKEGFTELFDKLVKTWPVKKFISEGWLAQYNYVVIRPDSEMKKRIDSLKKRGVDGDYQVKEMGTVMDNRASIEQLYLSYKQYAHGKQGIIYAINQEHAEHIHTYYEQQGEQIALIDARTSVHERDRLINDYQHGKVRILVNCDIYTEGYDAPFVQFIQLARPTLSLNKFLQQVGRGLRPNADGSHTMILDNVGMYFMFGLPDDDRDWDAMFQGGQLLPAPFIGESITQSASMLNTDEGHHLEMMQVIKCQEDGEEKVQLIHNNVLGEYNLLYKGKSITRGKHCYDTTGLVDGAIGLRTPQDGWSFYLDNGNYLCQLMLEVEMLLPNKICKVRNAYGVLVYYDLLMQMPYPCLPNIYQVGDASFVEEEDGWHLRTTHPYNCLGVQKADIWTEPQGVMMRKNQSIYLVKNGGKTVLHKSGQDAAETSTIIHKIKGTQYVTEVFQENNLWGIRKKDKILCKPKFKEIRQIVENKYILASLPENESLLVSSIQGEILFDKLPVHYIQNDKAYLTPYASMEDAVGYVHLTTGAIEWEWNSSRQINGFIFNKLTRYGKRTAYVPQQLDEKILKLEKEMYIQNGVLHATEYDTQTKVVSFEKDPQKFYRVIRELENGKSLIREVLIGREEEW